MSRPAEPPRPLMRRLLAAGSVVLLALAVAGGLFWTERAAEGRRAWADGLTGGRSEAAVPLLIAHGCAGCHAIPGVPGARGTVGPDLAGLAGRSYLGGVLRNTPENLVEWLRHSRDIDPKTAMPNTGASVDDARDMAAYLYAVGS